MVKWLSSCRLCVTLWTVAWQAPLSMGFFRQEYWRGLPHPPPGHLLDLREQTHTSGLLHWQVRPLPAVPPRKPSLHPAPQQSDLSPTPPQPLFSLCSFPPFVLMFLIVISMSPSSTPCSVSCLSILLPCCSSSETLLAL